MIKKRLWIASDRVFDRVTRTSYRRARDITMFTEAALSGPIGIAALHTYYLTYHNAFLVAYDKWNSHDGAQKSSTNKLTSRLKDLVGAAKAWDLEIQRVYSEGQPEYIALLPHGRKPFYSGKQNDRIRAVQALSLAIGSDPLLTAVKAEVDAFYAAIMAEYNAQKGQMTQTKGLADTLEAARVALCGALQYVKSGLEQHYVDNPDMVVNYFPMHLIQRAKTKDIAGRVAPLAIKEVAKRDFEVTDTMDIDNIGLGGLEFYTTSNKDGILPPGAIPVLVPARTKMHVAASQLGDINNKYLIVRNPSATTEGEFDVVM